MSSPFAKKIIKYGVTSGICLLLAIVYIFSHLDFQNLDVLKPVDWYLVLCDAFTIPGLLAVMLALLFAVSNQGSLDGVTYVTSIAIKKLIPGKAREMERYDDHVARRKEKQVKGYGFLFVIGFACLAVAGVFMALFYSVY